VETFQIFEVSAVTDIIAMIINQQSFLGGLAAQYNELRADPVTYQLLINGRVRDNSVSSILSPLQDTDAPTGLYQNLTAIGSVLLLFVSGTCWYRDLNSIYGWRRVSGMALDPSVDTIDTEMLPSSTLNYKRTGPIENVHFANSPARQTAEGCLACDGITQPSLIYPELGGVISARPTFTYAQWTETEDGSLREYVPIGRFPKFVGQKLYMAIKGPAGRLNRLAHSVSGRPLDFVIAINDTTGDKEGDALYTAHAVDFDDITGTFKSGGSTTIVVTTGRNTTGVQPDYSSLAFFGEPRFLNRTLFPSGVLNPNSAVDLNGDTAFISQTGIHSYNATMQTQIESNNDPVSIQVHQLLADNHLYGAAIDFDDYAMFAMETIHGPGVVVYDKTLDTEKKGRFIGLDLYKNIGQIKQFAKISTAAGQRLFFITQDNRLFEFGAGTTYETTRLYLGDWNGGVAGVSQILRRAHLVFSGVYSDTTVQVTNYVDRRNHLTVAYALPGASVTAAPTIPVPYKMVQGASNGMVHHESTDAALGFAVGILIEWASVARLVFARLDVDFESKVPNSLAMVPGTQATPFEFALVGDMDPDVVDSVWTKLDQTYQFVGVGNIGTWASYANTLQRLKPRWTAVAGNEDLDPDGGLIFYNRVINGARYYSRVQGNVEFFFYNVGWTTANIGTATGDADGFIEGSTQANWLKAQLAASTATFKVVVIHFPPYSSNTAYTQLRLPFRTWGASLVVSAHDKNYQRHIIDGLNYITVGTGSNSHSALGTAGTGYQTGRSGTAGYLRLIATAFSLKAEHVGVDGSVFDANIIYP
jgi:hypothetical protein